MTTNNNNRIPELRFPGFEGEWPIQPLSNFLHEHKTKSDGKCRVHSVSVSKGVVDQIEYLGRSFAASDTSKYNLAKPNDIIYTKSPTGSFPYGIVKMNKNPYNVIVSPLYGVYSPNNQYIGYIIDSFFESPERTNTYLSSLVQKGAKNTIQITNNTFISKNVCFPTDEAEQQKIADCLSSLDEEIAAEAQKADALKDHKKGLMQQLFPAMSNEQLAMSNCVPKLRFSGFTGSWEVKKLGEVANLSKGKGIAKSDIDIHGQTPCIRYGELYTRYGEQIKTVFSRTNIPSQDLVLGKVNDVIIPSSGETHEDIATASCILVPGVAIGGDINILRTPLNGLFLSYYLNSAKKHEIAHIAQGDAVVHLYGTQLSKLSICFPPTLAEQQKIADCLSELDEMISAQQQKVEALKEHKKGLMQKLFPKMSNTK